MKKVHKELMRLLSCSIRNSSIGSADYSEKELQTLFREAIAHDVYQLIYPVLSKSNLSKSQKLTEVMQNWKNRAFISGLHQKKCLSNSIRVIDELQKNKIDVMILKGMSLRYYYPNPDMRGMGDIDLFIKKRDIDMTIKILNTMYYTIHDSDSKHICLKHTEHLSVELHWELANAENYKNDISQFNKNLWDNVEQIKLGSIEAKTLNTNAQIVYVCLHMANHMLSSGFGLRPLCDLVLLIEKRKEDINWEFVFENLKGLGIDDFVCSLLVICNNYLELKLPAVIEEKVLTLKNKENAERLVADIIESGNHGNRTFSRTESRVILKRDKGEIGLSPRKFTKYFEMYFPNAATKYKYVKKFPFLMPFAFIHYLIKGAFIGNFKAMSKLAFFAKATLISYRRSKLLKCLNLR